MQGMKGNQENEMEKLEHDIARHVAICADLAREIERLRNAIGLIEAWPNTPPHVRSACRAALAQSLASRLEWRND